VPFHVSYPHQQGLQREKAKPGGKDGGMQIENRRARYGRMNQVLSDRTAESISDHGSNRERHQEIKIPVEKAATPDSHALPSIRADILIQLWPSMSRCCASGRKTRCADCAIKSLIAGSA
jgi:hypothetical protein